MRRRAVQVSGQIARLTTCRLTPRQAAVKDESGKCDRISGQVAARVRRQRVSASSLRSSSAVRQPCTTAIARGAFGPIWKGSFRCLQLVWRKSGGQLLHARREFSHGAGTTDYRHTVGGGRRVSRSRISDSGAPLPAAVRAAGPRTPRRRSGGRRCFKPQNNRPLRSLTDAASAISAELLAHG